MIKHIFSAILVILMLILLVFHHSNPELFEFDIEVTESGHHIEHKPPIYYSNVYLYYLYTYDYIVLLICILVAILVYWLRKKVNFLKRKNNK